MKYKVLIQKTEVLRANVEVEIPEQAPVGWDPRDWEAANLDEKLEWLAQDAAEEKASWWDYDTQTLMLDKEEVK